MDVYIVGTNHGKTSSKVHYLDPQYICQFGQQIQALGDGAFQTYPELCEEDITPMGGLCWLCRKNYQNVLGGRPKSSGV